MPDWRRIETNSDLRHANSVRVPGIFTKNVISQLLEQNPLDPVCLAYWNRISSHFLVPFHHDHKGTSRSRKWTKNKIPDLSYIDQIVSGGKHKLFEMKLPVLPQGETGPNNLSGTSIHPNRSLFRRSFGMRAVSYRNETRPPWFIQVAGGVSRNWGLKVWMLRMDVVSVDLKTHYSGSSELCWIFFYNGKS